MSRPFNLLEALAGKPVETSNGRPVTQLTLFTLLGNQRRLHGVINNEQIFCWSDTGSVSLLCHNPFDLCMTSVKKKYYLNIYKRIRHPGFSRPETYFYASQSFYSEQDAINEEKKPPVQGRREFVQRLVIETEE